MRRRYSDVALANTAITSTTDANHLKDARSHRIRNVIKPFFPRLVSEADDLDIGAVQFVNNGRM